LNHARAKHLHKQIAIISQFVFNKRLNGKQPSSTKS